jgi:hypothetical protein
VKLLFLTIIVLVIPTFFVFVFVMSTVNKLANLRDRCRDARRRIGANSAPTSATPGTSPPDAELKARQAYHFTVEQYNRARKEFPARLLAGLWGFREPEPLPHPPAGGSQPASR